VQEDQHVRSRPYAGTNHAYGGMQYVLSLAGHRRSRRNFRSLQQDWPCCCVVALQAPAVLCIGPEYDIPSWMCLIWSHVGFQMSRLPALHFKTREHRFVSQIVSGASRRVKGAIYDVYFIFMNGCIRCGDQPDTSAGCDL
jgi:hypothetical protein